MAKLTGATATAGSAYPELGGTPASAIDGSTGTAWVSANTFGNTVSDGLYLEFPTPVTVKRIRVMFYSWSRNIKIGYASAPSNVHASYTVIKDLDIPIGAVDELGRAWKYQGLNQSMETASNTILLTDNNVSSKYWAIFPDDATSGALSLTAGTVDRLRILEIELYDDVGVLPITTNPKPISGIPVLPFSATPSNWTRTEFATPGTFNFTPASDTTMLMIIAQGAGAGGRVNATLSGDSTPSNTDGGDSTIATTNGIVLAGPGGKTNVLPDAMFAGRTFDDWTRFTDGAYARAGAIGSTATGPVGGQSFLTGTVGAAFTLAGIQTNAPAETASNAFTGPNPTTKLTWTFTGNGLRQNTTGLSISTLGDTITIPFKAIEGQTVSLTFGATSGSKPANIKLNDVVVDTFNPGAQSSTRVINITETGSQVLVISMIGTSSGTLGLGNITFSNFGIINSRSGASGRLAIGYMLPKALSLTVGAGGVGRAGGQAVTAAQNGARGSGAGVGGTGGDGVIIVYEMKANPLYDKAALPALVNLNVTPTIEVAGTYRTNFIGAVGTKDTSQTFTHKLRARTKFVLALITGAGGRSSSGIMEHERWLPTTFEYNGRTFTGEAGQSGRFIGSGTGYGGAGGTFGPSADAVVSDTGTNGGSTSGNSANTSTIAGGYGSGGNAVYLGNAGGGCGGWGLVALECPANARTVSITIGDSSTVGQAGAVYLYETETEFEETVTQLAEMILAKQKQASTQVTQATELIFAKQKIATTQITQVPELILTKENDSANNMQVSHATIAFVVDAEDPSTNVTQTPELILAKQKRAFTQVTQAPELILAKQPFSVYRTSQVAEMIFLSEIPSIFWLNFGTIDNPVKNQMYTSLTGRATSVKDGAYIQLESAHADGTTMFINDVDVGLSGPVKNNDRVYIHGGIPNWWQTSINVYTYYITNGEVTRELVGTWFFNHPIRTPKISRAYAELALQTNWLKLAANIVRGASFTVLFTKANAAVASLTSVFTKALSASFDNVGVLFAQANAQFATAALGWELAKANASNVDTDGYDFVAAHSELSNEQTYVITKTHEGIETSTTTAEKYDAISHLTTLDDFEIIPAGLHDEDLFDFIENQASSKEYTNTEFDLIKAAYGDKVSLLTSDYTVGYGNVKTEMEKWEVDHRETAEAEFLPIVYTHYFGVFHVEVIPTIAYSVLVGVDYEFQKIYGTSSYLMPKGNADVQKAGFGTFETGTVWTISYSTPSDRDVIKSGAAERGYFDTYAIFTSAAYGHSGYEWVRDAKGMQTFELNSVFVQKGMQKVDLIPYRYAQTENGRGKASLYLGFDTQADAQTFTQNYSDVTITPRFNGFTYTVGVDKTFVCEIYFNGPVSGLIQGG